MKKALALTLAVALIGGAATFAAAHGGRGGGWGGGHMMWDRDFDNDRPGRHMMYDRDGDFDRRGRGPGYCFNLDRERPFGEVEKSEEAAGIVGEYLEATGNPNLKVGKVAEVGRDFEVEIVTSDGSLADKVLVEKRTGRILPAYR